MSFLRHYIRTPIVPRAKPTTCSCGCPRGPVGHVPVRLLGHMGTIARGIA